MPRILQSLSSLINFWGLKIENQTICIPLYMLYVHVDTAVTSGHKIPLHGQEQFLVHLFVHFKAHCSLPLVKASTWFSISRCNASLHARHEWERSLLKSESISLPLIRYRWVSALLIPPYPVTERCPPDHLLFLVDKLWENTLKVIYSSTIGHFQGCFTCCTHFSSSLLFGSN